MVMRLTVTVWKLRNAKRKADQDETGLPSLMRRSSVLLFGRCNCFYVFDSSIDFDMCHVASEREYYKI